MMGHSQQAVALKLNTRIVKFSGSSFTAPLLPRVAVDRDGQLAATQYSVEQCYFNLVHNLLWVLLMHVTIYVRR